MRGGIGEEEGGRMRGRKEGGREGERERGRERGWEGGREGGREGLFELLAPPLLQCLAPFCTARGLGHDGMSHQAGG